MKRLLIFPALVIVFALWTGCEKEDSSSSHDLEINNTEQNTSPNAISLEFDKAAYDQLVSDNKVRLAKLGINSARMYTETVMVPDDYSTIQEAVDNVSDYGNVIVKAGSYTENVAVYKPGLHIKAIGDVTLIGQFNLTADADGVKIHKFNIEGTGSGIRATGVTGGEVKQNNISGTGGTGIVYWNSSGVSIKQNDISGKAWGILFAASTDGNTSNNNTIQDNTVSGITLATCIGLQGDCDNNVFQGNTVSNNTNIYNASIFFFSFVDYQCDDNVIKNNAVTDNTLSGIWLPSGSGNTIGPNNTCNSNNYGIYLSAATSETHVFNNTALNNVTCDIVDEGGTDNTFKKNTAECIQMP